MTRSFLAAAALGSLNLATKLLSLIVVFVRMYQAEEPEPFWLAEEFGAGALPVPARPPQPPSHIIPAEAYNLVS